MKKAYLKELATQLLGSVTDSPDVLEYFSTDQSIFQIQPEAVVFPQNTADVRKTVQFAYARALAGKPISLTARGKGTDLGGAALGEGLQVVLPTHMNRLLRLDRDSVTVQPGIIYKTLQQTLHTHNRFLPPYPSDIDSATVGAAVASDTSGEKSVKYGTTRDFVRQLKVVLCDGSLIQTSRISARELNRRKGLDTLEGEIYRKVDSLLLDHSELIQKQTPKVHPNTAGYALSAVRGKDGSFDLGQVIIGSQGTLGIISEVTLRTVAYNPRTTLVVGYFESLDGAADATVKLRALGPSAVEMVDGHFLSFLGEEHSGATDGLVPDKLPKVMLFVEFDDFSQFRQKLLSNRARHLMARHGATCRVAVDPIEQVALWKLRRSAETTRSLTHHGSKRALPFMEDGVVPVNQLAAYLEKTYKLLAKHDLDMAVWGHMGLGNLRVQPFLDLAKKKDVDRLFTLAREYHQLVSSLGGTTSGGHGDGLVRGLSLEAVYGEAMVELFASLKHIFDPQGLFNPLQKTGLTEAYARAHMRSEYVLKHFDHIH